MELMVEKIKEELQPKKDFALEEKLAQRTKQVYDLEIKCRNLEDKIQGLVYERDKLAEISA